MQEMQETGLDPWVEKIPQMRKWELTQIFLPGKIHGQKSLRGYRPWGCKESDMIEHTHTQTIVDKHSCILQRNPRGDDSTLVGAVTETNTWGLAI